MSFMPLAAVPLAFGVFVWRNGGIVVGDKAHHEPSLHLVQPLYCALFCAATLWPVTFSPSR